MIDIESTKNPKFATKEKNVNVNQNKQFLNCCKLYLDIILLRK